MYAATRRMVATLCAPRAVSTVFGIGRQPCHSCGSENASTAPPTAKNGGRTDGALSRAAASERSLARAARRAKRTKSTSSAPVFQCAMGVAVVKQKQCTNQR
jgi:hypothetical protein